MTVLRPHSPAAGDNAPGYRAIRWNMDWITRPLFGIALAGVAIGVLFSRPEFFASLVVLITILSRLRMASHGGGGPAYRVANGA